MIILGGDRVSEAQSDRIADMTDALRADMQANVMWDDNGVKRAIVEVQSGATMIMTTSDLIALKSAPNSCTLRF